MSDLDTAAPEAPAEAELPADAPEELEVPADLVLDDEETVETPEAPSTEADPFADFGGRDRVAEAVRVHELTQSDQGVVQLFIEAGRSLGLSFEQMEALFGQGAPAAATEEPDLDEPMTRGEWLAWQKEQQQQAAAAQQHTTFTAAQKAIATTVEELGLKMDDEATKLVLQFGDKHFDRQNPTPENVRNAVVKGHAEYQAFVDKQARDYLRAKQQKAAGVPKAPVGAPAGERVPDEPRDAAEAAARVRKRLGY